MSTSQPPTVDPAARELVAAVRTFVDELMRDVLRMQMRGGEVVTSAYARACMENLPELSGDTGEPAAGDIWHPSTWDRVSPRLGKRHKGLKKEGGGRVDGFSCRYWPAPRMSPDRAPCPGSCGSSRRPGSRPQCGLTRGSTDLVPDNREPCVTGTQAGRMNLPRLPDREIAWREDVSPQTVENLRRRRAA